MTNRRSPREIETALDDLESESDAKGSEFSVTIRRVPYGEDTDDLEFETVSDDDSWATVEQPTGFFDDLEREILRLERRGLERWRAEREVSD